MDWKTGHHVSVDFSRDNFNHPYRQYLKRLESLREKFGADVYQQYLSDFYEAASYVFFFVIARDLVTEIILQGLSTMMMMMVASRRETGM